MSKPPLLEPNDELMNPLVSHGHNMPSVDLGVSAYSTTERLRRKALALRISRMITDVGNFSVMYNFASISISLIMMSVVECTSTPMDCKQGKQLPWVDGTASATVFIGSLVGTLTMGYLGDLLGRNAAMTITLAITTFGAMLSSIAPAGDASTVYHVIIVFRFVMGVGLGGIFPLSAVKAAEDAAKNSDGADDRDEGAVDVTSAASSYFWQSPGAMAPWFVAMCLTYTDLSEDAKWRLLLGLGAVPAFLMTVLSYFESRLTGEEQQGGPMRVSISLGMSPSRRNYDRNGRGSDGRGSLEVLATGAIPLNPPSIAKEGRDGNGKGSRNNSSGSRTSYDDEPIEINLWALLASRQYQKKLIATGFCWFLYDICYYGVTLFGGEILEDINIDMDDNVTTGVNIRTVSNQQMLALSMAIPATIGTIMLLKYYSTKSIAIYGFYFIAACFLLLAFLINHLKNNPTGLLCAYCLLNFALNAGPSVSCFVLPAETYPKAVRSTFNGISVAISKVGAIVGAYMFEPLVRATSLAFIMAFCAGLAVLGALLSQAFVDEPSKPYIGLGLDEDDVDTTASDGDCGSRSSSGTMAEFDKKMRQAQGSDHVTLLSDQSSHALSGDGV